MPNSNKMPDAEAKLRACLQRAADQAPAYVPELEATLVRRRIAATHRRRVASLVAGTAVAVAAAIVLVVVQHQRPGTANVAGASPAIRGIAPPMAPDPLSCPASLAGFTAPATHEAISATLVPGTPSSVHACSYSADVVGGTTYGSDLDGSDLSMVVKQLNAMKADHDQSLCSPGLSAPVLLRFGYATGDEVDVMLTVGSKCSTASNGVLTRWSAAPIVIPLLGQYLLIQQMSVPSTTGQPGSAATTQSSQPDNPPVTAATHAPSPTTTGRTSNSK